MLVDRDRVNTNYSTVTYFSTLVYNNDIFMLRIALLHPQ